MVVTQNNDLIHFVEPTVHIVIAYDTDVTR